MPSLFKNISDGSISTAKLADSAVTTAKLADLNVTTAKLADDAITSEKVGLATVEDISGSTYSISLSDMGKIKRFTNSSAVTITVPDTLPIGFSCLWTQAGTGQLTFQGGGSLNLRNYGSQLKSAGQYASGSIVIVSTNEGRLYGERSA